MQTDMVRTVAPAGPLVTLDQARAHLRVDRVGDDYAEVEDDTLIGAIVAAATAEIDGWDGWLGRALMTQTWRMRLTVWPFSGRIVLPLPPFQEIDDFRIVDPAGDEVVLAAGTDYAVHGTDPAWLEPAPGRCWPAINARGLPVSVTFTCGYGDAVDVPAPISTYVRMRLGQFYEHREAIVVGASVAELPFVRHMIDGYRFRGVMP